MSARHHTQPVQWRVFRCPVCGSKILAPKRNIRRRTHFGHRKAIWCFQCRKVVNHIQIS